MTGTALILGGTGKFGHNMAEALWNAGWTVRLFDRKTDSLPDAAYGADIIVNAAHPGDYTRWTAEQPALTASVVSK